MLKMDDIMQKGITLLEMLYTLSILIVLTAIAAPMLAKMIERTDSETVRDQLVRSLQFARATAVAQHRQVTVCGSDNALHCSDNWTNGWIVIIPAQDIVVFSHRFTKPQTLAWSGFSKRLKFYENGTLPAGNGHFWFCGRDKKEVRWQVVTSRQGRLRFETPPTETSCP